jgi:hypothetical protein
MSTVAAAAGGVGRAPARVITALATSVALTAVAVTFSVGMVTGTSLATTPQAGPTTGALVVAPWCAPSQTRSVEQGPSSSAHLPSPRPQPTTPPSGAAPR